MRAARWAPISGIVFVVALILVFVVIGEGPGDSDQEITSWYADGGNRNSTFAGWVLVLIAALALVWFASVLRVRVHMRGDSMLPSLGQGGAVAAAALWLGAISAWNAIASSIEDSDEFVLDPNTSRVLDSLGEILFISAGVMVSLLVFATSVGAFKTGALPKWLAWLGIPVAILMLFTFFFIPFLIFLGWVLVVSFMLIWKPAESAAPAAAG